MWTSLMLPAGSGVLRGIACPGVGSCDAVGGNPSDTATTLATDDGGATWTAQYAAIGTYNNSLNRVACVSATNCMSVGSAV